jgi:hypothetical protein
MVRAAGDPAEMGISCYERYQALFSREDRLSMLMNRGAKPKEENRQSLSSASVARLLASVLVLSGLYAGLPHGGCQSSQEAADTDRQSKSGTETARSSLAPALSTKRQQSFSKPYGYYLNPILEHIQANPDQRVKITAIVQSFRGRIQPMTEEYRQKNKEFLDNVAHGRAPELIMEQQIQVGRLYSDITLAYCQMSLEVRKVLSADQIVRYEEFKRAQGWLSSKTANEPVQALPASHHK